MKRLLPLLLVWLVFGIPALRAQAPQFTMPVNIDSVHTYQAQNGIIIAEGNVSIRYGESTIYCDKAMYYPDSNEVLLLGNVRIYRIGHLFTGDRAVYNLDTKKITAADFRADVYPFLVETDTLTSMGPTAYRTREGFFTTSDNSKPDYHMSARSARIYPGDRIILDNVTFYVGQTPIFWFPSVYQSLNKNEGLFVVPGFTSIFGGYLRSRYTFPLTQDIGLTFNLDLMTKRGAGIGLDSRWEGGDNKEEREWGRFRSYFIHDIESGLNETSLSRPAIDPNRYRVSLQDRTYLAENLYSSVNINKVSDAFFLQDFAPGEFRTDPNPDNVVFLTKWDEDYTLTLTARKSLNNFFDFTERLPELAFDGVTRPIFGNSGLFMTSDGSVGDYRRDFAKGSLFQEYQSFRADGFIQLEYPKTLFNWLNIVPKAGIRETYYENTGQFEAVPSTGDVTLSDGAVLAAGTPVPELFRGGSVFRTVVDAGFETSFKLSRAYEEVQSRPWGLDGLRHVFQPYADFSYVYTSKNPQQLLQFDRISPSTEREPIDFPDFTSVDAIDNWAIVRLGVNNRFQTRRDNQTINWLEINTYFDINIQRPEFEQTFLSLPISDANIKTKTPLQGIVADPGTFSNVYNRIRWQPYSWLKATVDTQFPMLDAGFTEVNADVTYLLNADTSILLGHEYIQGNPLFPDSNYVTVGAYRRITDNWAVSFRDSYEFNGGYLADQRYSIHRDLSSWVASLTVEAINEGTGKYIYSVALVFTIKDMPQVSLPLSFNPEEVVGGSSSP
jgi:lipopolysaccharide assembly outer membrane protein LptD (OstA)